jgi:hypothetical protein
MSRTFPRLTRLFLAAALVFVGVIAHTGSVVHAASGDFGVPHEHAAHAEAEATSLTAQSGSIDLATSDKNDPSHSPGICIDAHCCTPAVQMAAQDVLRHALESGKHVIAAASDHALSMRHPLLRPPRTST